MTIDRRLDPETDVLWTTMRDGITLDDLRQHIEALDEMEAHRYREIVDARGAEPLFVLKEFAEIARLARQNFGHRRMAPRAIVVDEKDLRAFGLARIFATLVSPWITLRVFDNVQAAIAFVTVQVDGREASAPE